MDISRMGALRALKQLTSTWTEIFWWSFQFVHVWTTVLSGDWSLKRRIVRVLIEDVTNQLFGNVFGRCDDAALNVTHDSLNSVFCETCPRTVAYWTWTVPTFFASNEPYGAHTDRLLVLLDMGLTWVISGARKCLPPFVFACLSLPDWLSHFLHCFFLALRLLCSLSLVDDCVFVHDVQQICFIYFFFEFFMFFFFFFSCFLINQSSWLDWSS